MKRANADPSERLSDRSRLVKNAIFCFVAGILLVVFSEALLREPDENRAHAVSIVIVLLGRCGEAAVIASIVAYFFERRLADDHHEEVKEILKNQDQFYKAGFRQAFESRRSAFDGLVRAIRTQSVRELRISGICVSLFHEVAGGKLRSGVDGDKLIAWIARLLSEKVCTIEILCLRRYPDDEQLEAYGGGKSDLYSMREIDEDIPDMLVPGRLKKHANRSIGSWIDVYVRVAELLKDKPPAARRDALSRMKVKEYLALPALSVTVIDHEIYVTPYLYRRRCRDVPSFCVADRESPLFQEYYSHFERMWNDSLCIEAIPQRFIDLLSDKPTETIDAYEKALGNVITEKGPTYDQREEQAVASVVSS